MKAFGILTGELARWAEFYEGQLITVGSQDLFYIKEISSLEGSVMTALLKAKIGIRSSSSESKEILVGFTNLTSSHNKSTIISLSKNGALHFLSPDVNSDENSKIVTKKLKGHCFTFFPDISRSILHCATLHVGPLVCTKCKEMQCDLSSSNSTKGDVFTLVGLLAVNLFTKGL